MVTQPLRRAEALLQFSKDHHFTLLLVWKIRQGLRHSVEPGRIKKYINYFFENFLSQHFREEEQLLFSELEEDNSLRQMAIEDHNYLYQLNEQIKITAEVSRFRIFSDRLEQHIRFEERTLFTLLQNSLPASKMESVLEKMSSSHAAQKQDTWEDEFWKSAPGI